jgi:hypothetical protein
MTAVELWCIVGKVVGAMAVAGVLGTLAGRFIAWGMGSDDGEGA